MTDTEELRRLAEQATPGPWTWAEYENRPGTAYVAAGEGRHLIDNQEDAAYIAAASPDVVLELLDDRDALARKLDEWLEANAREYRLRMDAERRVAALEAAASGVIQAWHRDEGSPPNGPLHRAVTELDAVLERSDIAQHAEPAAPTEPLPVPSDYGIRSRQKGALIRRRRP